MGVHNAEAYPKIKELLGIPEDEPIFILRAQDGFSTRNIARYTNDVMLLAEKAPDLEWKNHMEEIMQTFSDWQHTHTTKTPD
jgi:hypothetical protein